MSVCLLDYFNFLLIKHVHIKEILNNSQNYTQSVGRNMSVNSRDMSELRHGFGREKFVNDNPSS